MKTCGRCHTEKPIESFGVARRNRDGKTYWCLDCKRQYDSKYSASNRQKINKYRRDTRGTEINRARERRSARAYRMRHPERARAKRLLRDALIRGDMVRPIWCEECGSIPRRRPDGRSGLHGHHADYAKPLDVTWLCPECHANAHGARAKEGK